MKWIDLTETTQFLLVFQIMFFVIVVISIYFTKSDRKYISKQKQKIYNELDAVRISLDRVKEEINSLRFEADKIKAKLFRLKELNDRLESLEYNLKSEFEAFKEEIRKMLRWE